MDQYELKQAARAQEALERAERDLEAVSGYEIDGISIQHVERPAGSPITLRSGCSGTGSISGIGFPADFKAALNEAMLAYFRSKAENCRAELARLGINIAA